MGKALPFSVAVSSIPNMEEFRELILDLFTEVYDPQYIFYFEREDLLPEVRLVFGNQAAEDLDSSQYFYQFKDLAFQLFGRKAQIVEEIDSQQGRNSFTSALFYPVDFTRAAKGMLVIGNPRSKPRFQVEDIRVVQEILSELDSSVENFKLRRSLELYDVEISLINKITYLVDLSTQAGLFFKCLGQLIAEAVDCQIVIFLMQDQEKGIYTLEAGNDAGCEFWVGQTEFFRALAKDSEYKGTFSESYGGKFFKGEKYGLEKLETSLIVPVEFYHQSRGVFILLNKNGLQNFRSFDIRLVNLVSGFSKAVIYRELEKKKLGSLFKRFVSDKIGDKILKNEDYSLELEGRTRLTSLFVDINGFTAFAESRDPGLITRQLNMYLQAMTDLIVEHGGTLDKYLGDGIMAVFGSPQKFSNHAERAVECALAMQARMSDLTGQWVEQGLATMTASIGISTGEALVGAIGCDRFLDYTAIGEVINLSSRLCGAARRGTILVSESTWESMQDVVDAEPITGLKLKGMSGAIPAYEIQGLLDIGTVSDRLSQARYHQRVRMIAALGNFAAYHNSDVVLEFLQDSDPQVRLAVVESLRLLNREHHLHKLINHLEKEEVPLIRRSILDLISQIHTDPLLPLMDKVMQGVALGLRPAILRSTLDSPARDDRRLFLALIRYLQESEELQSSMMADLTKILYSTDSVPIMRLLIEALHSARPSEKISVVRTLAKLDVPQIAAPLVRTLEDEIDSPMAYAVADAIGSITNPRTLKLLAMLFLESSRLLAWQKLVHCRQHNCEASAYRALLYGGDRVLKYATLHLIAQRPCPELEDELLQMLSLESEMLFAVRILQCLRKCPDSRLLPALKALYGSSPQLDVAILSEIGFRKATNLLDLVHQAIDSPDVNIKGQAILAAGRIADVSSLPYLMNALDEQDTANNTATIIRVLGAFPSEHVLLRVVQALSSPIGRIRANAIDSLMSLNAAETVNQIERLLQDDNNRARANAALACLRFGRIQHFSILAEMASSTNKWMRLSCLWALSVTGMPKAREIILGLIRDPDYDVLLSAIGFLKKIEKSSR